MFQSGYQIDSRIGCESISKKVLGCIYAKLFSMDIDTEVTKVVRTLGL